MIVRIIRIQAAFRGYMARKYVRAVKQSYYAAQGMMHFQNDGGDIVYNYDNPEVMVNISE